MPLPLTFGKPPIGVKKLDSISEEDEDSESTISSASPKTKPLDQSARPKPSTVNNYPFKMSDDSNRKSEQRINNFSTTPTASTSGSNLSHDTHITDLDEIKTSIKQLIEAQQQQQRSIEETRKVILQHMLSSKEELSTLQQGISQLHTSAGQTSKAIDDANLRVLADELKSMNANHRESIVSMKLSVENERKAFLEQLSNERWTSSNLRNELELRNMEKKELEMEKEKLARQWKQLERSEALFEQRKLAASEGIENAEKMMSMIRAAESRLNSEMERLVHLSDYVREKDIKAQEQLEHARELTNKLLEIDVSRYEYFENSEKCQQEMSESRMILARERVALLKERASERGMRLVCIGKRGST